MRIIHNGRIEDLFQTAKLEAKWHLDDSMYMENSLKIHATLNFTSS